MKTNTLLTIVIVLLATLIGLMIYMFSGRAEKQAIAHIEQEISTKNDTQMAHLKQVAFDNESIQLANSGFAHIKMQMQVYLSDKGQLPKSLMDLNLAPNWTPSAKIKSVSIDNQSVVKFNIDNAHSKGTLIFTPSIHQDSYIDWQCTTPDIKDIGLHMPTCAYIGQ